MLDSQRAKEQMAKVLPKHLTPERMTRVALTAIMKTPNLLNCTPESLLNAVLLCSQAGLEPDGRLAHLIPYGNTVQVIFDYKGLVTLALRNGGMEQIYADKVCEHDTFKAWVSDGKKKIEHAINWGKPRGNAYAYYAVTQNAKGVIDWEVMTTEEVDDIRKRSKASGSGPWVTDYDEMAKKTVLRRMSKRWDLLPEISEVMEREDDNLPPIGGVTVSAPVFREKPAKITEKAGEGKGDGGSSTPQEAPAASYGGTSEPEPASPSSGAPEPGPEPPKAPESPVKRLRVLCKESKVKESQVLEFLQQLGSISEDIGTSEELALNAAPTMTMLIEQFNDIAEKIKTAAK